jgi:hypothetical protein
MEPPPPLRPPLGGVLARPDERSPADQWRGRLLGPTEDRLRPGVPLALGVATAGGC